MQDQTTRPSSFKALLITLAATLVLLSIVLFFEWRDIEQDLENSSAEVLNRAGLEWSNAETHNRGREVAVYGTAPNSTAVEQALAEVKKLDGVRKVTFLGSVEEQVEEQGRSTDTTTADTRSEPLAQAPSVELSLADGTAVVSGSVSSQLEIDALIAAAMESFGEDSVLNQLEVARVSELNASLTNALEVLASADFEHPDFPNTPAGIRLNGDKATLFGLMENESNRQQLLDRMATVYDGDIDSEISVLKLDEYKAESVLEDRDKTECLNKLNELISNSDINFATGSSLIPASSRGIAEDVTTAVKRCPKVVLSIEGHTDDTGNAQDNKDLSLARAEAVKAFLIENGVRANKLKTVGFSAEVPKADNTSDAGRAQNRRIEFKLAE